MRRSDHGLRAVVVVHVERIRDTCGYAVPLMTYAGERDLHARRFSREDDESLSRYFEGKEHVATGLDGLPGLPLPLSRLHDAEAPADPVQSP